MYEGKIVKKDKPMDNLEETVNIVKKASVKAMKQLVPESVDDEETWQTQLENLIMRELVKPPEKPVPKIAKKFAKSKAKQEEEEDYQEVEVAEVEDVESEFSDSDEN